MNHRRDPYITNFSRQKAIRRDLKIIEFEEALQRQQRSLKKLRESEDAQKQITLQYRNREPIDIQPYEYECHAGPALRRQPKPYVPLSRQPEPVLTNEQIKQWEYLQSTDYQHYLEEILSATGNGKARAQKIKSIRSNNIYLQSRKNNQYEPTIQQLSRKPTFESIEYMQPVSTMNSLIQYSKTTEKQTYYPPMTLTCIPYLEKSSMLDQIHEEADELSSERQQQWQHQHQQLQQLSIAPYYEDVPQINRYYRQEQIRIDEEEEEYPLTPHCHTKTEENAKTVMRSKNHPTTDPLLASTKANLARNQQLQRQKRQFIDRQLSRYDKENKLKTEVTPSKTPKIAQKSQQKPTYLAENHYEQSKRAKNAMAAAQTPSASESREFYRKDRMQVSSASLYNIDFKLDRPDRQDHSFTRCASAITLSQEKSIAHSKSNTKIKMSVVTASGRQNR